LYHSNTLTLFTNPSMWQVARCCHFWFRLTSPFFRHYSRLGHVSSSEEESLQIAGANTFYRPDALPVTQPTVSKHWRQSLLNTNICNHDSVWKKRSERRKHCALAIVRLSQKISPRRRPLRGDTERPQFNQLEIVTTFTYKSSLVRIDERNFELSW